MSFRHHGFISIFLIASLISVSTAVSVICNSERGRLTTYCVVPGMGPTTTLIERTSAQNYSKVCLKGIDFGLAENQVGDVAIWVNPECGGVFEVTHFGPPSWGSWGAWGACSASCDKGQQIRNRTCSSRVSSDCSSFNNYDKEQRSCNERSCESMREEVYSICGTNPSSFGDRILGGSPASKCQYPWMVMVYNSNAKYFCGGSIIDQTHILTTASCVVNTTIPNSFVTIKASDLRVFSGSSNMPLLTPPEDDTGIKMRMVANVVTHEAYVYQEGEKNDIALLTLSEPIEFDNCHVPICLANNSDPSKIEDCKVMGWGLTSNGPNAALPKKLMYTSVNIIDPMVCDIFYTTLFDESKHICTRRFEHGACLGDFGGPLVCTKSDGRSYQQGIVSHGIEDNCGLLPNFHTSIPPFLRWIESKI